METTQENKEHYPGEAPITTDDLIFQIGELSVDLERKKKAIQEVMTKLWNVSQEKIKLEEQILTDGGLFESNSKQIQIEVDKAQARIKADYEKTIEQLKKKLEKQRKELSKLKDE